MSDDWRLDAACRGMDPELFFPDRGEFPEWVRAICKSCPVREPCLEAGLRERHGVWGGLSERERRAERRRRRQKVPAKRRLYARRLTVVNGER